MSIVGQGGKIILFTLPSLMAVIGVHMDLPEMAGLRRRMEFIKPVEYLSGPEASYAYNRKVNDVTRGETY